MKEVRQTVNGNARRQRETQSGSAAGGKSGLALPESFLANPKF
jgi:hypothetical protein